MNECVVRRLKLYGSSRGVRAVVGDRKIAVVGTVEELCALVVVEHAEGDVFVGMKFAYIEGEPSIEEILAPVKDIQGDGLLRAAALKAVQINSGAQAVAQIELLTLSNVHSGSNEQADRATSTAVLVDVPGACDIEPAAELIGMDSVGRYGCILIQEGVGGAGLQPQRFGSSACDLVDWAEERSQRVRLNERICGYLRQCDRVGIKLLFQLVVVYLGETRERGCLVGDGGGGACLSVSGEGCQRQKGSESERADHEVRVHEKLEPSHEHWREQA